MHRARWIVVSTAAGVAGVAALPGAGATGGWRGSEMWQAALITPAALACLAGALVVVVVGWRGSLMEVAVLGAALTVQSVLATAHGVAAGMGADAVSWWTMALAFPAGAAASLPVLLP